MERQQQKTKICTKLREDERKISAPQPWYRSVEDVIYSYSQNNEIWQDSNTTGNSSWRRDYILIEPRLYWLNSLVACHIRKRACDWMFDWSFRCPNPKLHKAHFLIWTLWACWKKKRKKLCILAPMLKYWRGTYHIDSVNKMASDQDSVLDLGVRTRRGTVWCGWHELDWW